MASKKKPVAAPEQPKRFEEIVSERMPKQPTTRERLAQAVEDRAAARAKIDAQAEDKDKAKRKARNARILARHHGRRTSEFYRDVAEADREAMR